MMTQAPPIGVFLASHNADTGMKYWGLERWRREIEDLRRMGANTVWFLPIQFGQRSPSDFEPGASSWELQKEIASSIAAAGLKVGVYQGLNDVFPETLRARPEWEAASGKYFLEEAHACPSLPGAWAEILRLRARFFAELPRIDYLITPATDYGGCSCGRCSPWPRTYLDRFREQAALCRRHHPNVSIVAAGHGITPTDEDELRGLLRAADWVDFTADLPRGAGKPIIKYYMTPEITMLGGWGKAGPCPILPEIARHYADDLAGVAGWVPYSEGVHDDINRFACLRHAKDSTLSAAETALAYVTEWLGLDGQTSRDVADAVMGLGRIDRPDRIYVDPDVSPVDRDADRRLEVLNDARGSHPALADNSRYWLLLYRALYESFSVSEGKLSIDWLDEEVAACREGLRVTEPAYARFLEGLHPTQLIGKTAWCWPRTFRQYWGRERVHAAHELASATSSEKG